MEKIKFIRVALFLFGFIATGIGGALLFFPVSFEASAGIVLDENISLLSEIRAYGGIILSGGIIVFLGSFFDKLLLISSGVSSLFYLSLGLSRLISLFIDGVPSQALVTAGIAEILIGLVSLLMFLKIDKQDPFRL
ncbi:DUF4345 domain-containing protein [Algoriphagus resistens]|uniref:DUF4345 domain-containing protein n=1 Tax=Algoriphagus resistens TaxID=1750590 RepID=UPI00071691D8|nr:DUF4345 domain-containing protein [Algoriphagus resistens]